MVRTVNTEMVRMYWLIGQVIFEEEQRGKERAEYGQELIAQLATKLQAKFGTGYTPTNLKYMRQFYQRYPRLLDEPIGHAARDQSESPSAEQAIGHAPKRIKAKAND